MARWLMVLLIVMLVGLQSRLWIGQGSMAQVASLKRDVAVQQIENQRLTVRNQHLLADVNDLKTGYDGIENRARTELGMIKRGETYFLLLDNH